jgi:hypothetical protein
MADVRTVAILRDPADQVAAQAPVSWALEQLQTALRALGVGAEIRRRLEETAADELCVLVAGAADPLARAVLAAAQVAVPNAAEGLALARGTASLPPSGGQGESGRREVVVAGGADVRGLVYAVLELADRVAHAADGAQALAALQLDRPIVEQPANRVRSVMRLFASDVEDKPWFNDRAFWPPYLSMLATQRFNRFHLALGLSYDFPRRVRDAYLYFAYPFLVDVPGYDVRVRGLPDDERDRNLAMLRFISEQAAARGLHFQLGLWTHAYELIDSPDANYTITGLSPERHAAYCRDALRLLLEACPAISGVTFRIHGESGIPERSYDFWRTVFSAIADVAKTGRRLEIDLHAKGIDQEMIRLALATGVPVSVSPKYWAEHMGPPYHQAAIRPVEHPQPPQGERGRFMVLSEAERRFTRYGYADLMGEDREYGVLFRIWPGTQRVLLWGDPAMAAGYGRFGHFCDALGVELFEPLSFKGRRGSGLPGPRDGYADTALRPKDGDWEKYRYTYRLFGRLLYQPEADPETWRRSLRKDFGPAAEAIESALASASRILPLVTVAYLPSAANNSYWPEMYTTMPIARSDDDPRPVPYGDTPSPKRFGTVSPLDPELFCRVEEFAGELVSGRRSGKYSPLDVARWLEGFAQGAVERLSQALIADRADPAFRRLAIDVAIQAGLGRFFAGKLRAGVDYALYRQTGDVPALRRAIDAYRRARRAWVEAAEAARGVYVDDLTYGPEPRLRGHWLDRLAAIDQDILDLEAALAGAPDNAGTAARDRRPDPTCGGEGQDSRQRPDGWPADETEPDEARPALEHLHTPPASFERGRPVDVVLHLRRVPPDAVPVAVSLRYRHVNQAEQYLEVEMASDGRGYRATIPGDYTDSPYPLQYYFRLRDARGRAWLYPGLAPDLSNQPYFVVRLARPA